MTTVRLVRGSRKCCLISINRSVVVAIVVVVVAMIIFNLSDSAIDVDSAAVAIAETRYYYFHLASQQLLQIFLWYGWYFEDPNDRSVTLSFSICSMPAVRLFFFSSI